MILIFPWIIVVKNFLHYHAEPAQAYIKVVKRHFKIAFSCLMFINNYKFKQIAKYLFLLLTYKYLKVYYETYE